ncbi:uncharacterized protein LOC129599296 [Paramacrobiotus metropolitanus]|uniref:uncharacterized protein LOC129599296 n=1 Tax=Paramacrobiotus metropolitanus TaxID=2943436 RepID=UPI002445AF47|nr:uncharacterized protein LOC129599296 [Paramacrobiotus metropolitanus]
MPALVVVCDAGIFVDGDLAVEGQSIHTGDDDKIVRIDFPESQKKLAVKYFTRELPNKRRDWTRIERLRTLENPYITNYYYAGSLTHDRIGLLMEYFPTRDLFASEGRFNILQTLQISHEILQGIAFLHGIGIAHGNLCSTSILLNQSSQREAPFPKIIGIERVPPIVKKSATKPDTSKDMNNATPEDFVKQCAWNIWSFGDILWDLVNKTSYDNLRLDIMRNPYYTQDTLPMLANAKRLVDNLLPRIPPGMLDLMHLCRRMHSYERPTAEELQQHYIFAMDVPFEERERQRLFRILQFLGTEYYRPLSQQQSEKQYYTKIKRIHRVQQSNEFYVTTVDHADGKFGKRLIWESIFPCLLEFRMPADRGFLDRLYAFRDKEMLRFCGLQHQSIYPMLQCYLRYIHDYISVVYQFEIICSENLELFLEKLALPWNYIKIYCRQLLEGLMFLEERGLRIQGICSYMVSLCSRHMTGTFMQAKIHMVHYLDELLMETFVRQSNNSELLRNQRRVGRCISPEAALLPSISGLLHASSQQQVWGMGHILLQMATSAELQFEKLAQNGETETRNVSADVSNGAVMEWLRDGWRPKVPTTLADGVRRVLEMCFRVKEKRPSLQELAADVFFRTAMPLEAVVNSTMLPVFCMRPLTVGEMGQVFNGYNPGAKENEVQIIDMVAEAGREAGIFPTFLQYRNFDSDRPLAIELRSLNNFNQVAFSPANDLVVDLTIFGVSGLDCEIFKELNLPNLLSLRLYHCQDVVLGPGCLKVFPKLRCFEVPECSFFQFHEDVLREIPQLEMVILDNNAAGLSEPALIERIRCENKFAELKQYLQNHPDLIQSRAGGDVWRYQRLTSRLNTGCALDWLGSTSAACPLPARCIQIGLHGEFRLRSSDVQNVIKIITADDLDNADYNREVRRLCELNHSNVVTLSICESASRNALTLRMKYYSEVGSLGDFLSRNRRVPPTLLQITELTHGILLGLQYLHSTERKTLHPLHGALHPWNIMLESNEVFFTPKLSDMDKHLQKLYLRQQIQKNHHTYSRYANWYMSPEMLQCTGAGCFDKLTSKTDVWSFGRIVLYLFEERMQIAKEAQTIIDTFDINSNMFYVEEDRPPWFAFTNEAMPPAVIDLVYLTHKDDPRDRPGAAILLHHFVYRKDLPLKNRLSRQVRTDAMPTLSSCIYPPVMPLRHSGSVQSGNIIAVQICKEWVIPSPHSHLESKDLAHSKLSYLVQQMIIRSDVIIKFATVHLLSTDVLRFSGYCYFKPENINLRWHMDNFALSMTEIRTYCINILHGLQYLQDNHIDGEPITIDSVYLCNQHACGIYQTAKIIITPSLLDLFSPDKRLEMLSTSTGYAFAPEEISGYSRDQVHKANIWHFGQILLDMAEVQIRGYCFEETPNTQNDAAMQNALIVNRFRNPSAFLKAGMRPTIPWYFSDPLQGILRKCFAEKVLRPTANQLQSFANIRESFFYCSPDIQYKILYNEWPRFARRVTNVDECDTWTNVLYPRTTPNVNALPANRIKAGFWPGGNRLDVLNLFRIRTMDRDHPMTVWIFNETSLQRRMFSPVSDLIVKLVIGNTANFDCRLLQGLHLYNLLSLRFENCTGIRISQRDLSGFPRLRSLKFTRSTILSFEVGALSHLYWLCNLDLTGDLCLPQTDELEEYIERLLSCESFGELRKFLQHHRELIQAKDTPLVEPYKARNLGHLTFLL